MFLDTSDAGAPGLSDALEKTYRPRAARKFGHSPVIIMGKGQKQNNHGPSISDTLYTHSVANNDGGNNHEPQFVSRPHPLHQYRNLLFVISFGLEDRNAFFFPVN